MSTIIDIINILTAVVAMASAVAAMTPDPKDDLWVAKAKKFIDILALNIGARSRG